MNRENLRSWVFALAGPSVPGREPGSRSARLSAELIGNAFAGFDARQHSEQGYCVRFRHHGIVDENVVAHLPAASSDRGCWVVIGAHYDTLGLDAQRRVRPGADDNATGVAVMLEVARVVSAAGQRPQFGIVFAAFSSEETGLIGSQAWVASPTVPLDQVALMINVDMVGRRLLGNAGLGYEAVGGDTARSTTWMRKAGAAAGVGVIPMRLNGRGDSASFSPQVPTVFLTTADDPDYHRWTDTPERVDYEQVERTAKLMMALLGEVRCPRGN